MHTYIIRIYNDKFFLLKIPCYRISKSPFLLNVSLLLLDCKESLSSFCNTHAISRPFLDPSFRFCIRNFAFPEK